MNQKELFKIIKFCLKTKETINMKSSTRNVEEWDSLGQLAILTTLDKKLKNKTSKLTKLADAETVKAIHDILKKAKLII